MINVPLYSQRDERWANKKLGFSDLKFKTHGCTVTALASFVSHIYNDKITPDVVNTKLKEVKGFSGALVIWNRLPIVFPKFKWVKRAYNYSNAEVSYYVYLKRTPVMVQVNAYPIGAPVHWVLFTGSRKMMDPWYGRIDSTSKYIPTGYALFNIV